MTEELKGSRSVEGAVASNVTSSTSSSTDNLVHLLKVSPNGQLLAISTPESTSIYSTTSSNLFASLKTVLLPFQNPTSTTPTSSIDSVSQIAFPRCLSFSPDSTKLAIIGDDKTVRIWDVSIDKDGKLVGFEYGKQILYKELPKRASMIAWEDNTTIIVADKFGDLRSFEIGATPSQPPIKKSADKKPPAKKAKTEQTEIEEEEEQSLDLSLKPHLGHVSLLTSFLLAGISPKDSSSRHIITADRDGHIRISRWGNKKAGWVTENFLLGSEGCVGDILLIPSSSGKEEALLLSTDGGSTLNLWNYLTPAGKKQRVSTSVVRKALVDRIAICPERERCRESSHLTEGGRYKAPAKKGGRGSKQTQPEDGKAIAELDKKELPSESDIDPALQETLQTVESAKQDLGLIMTSLRSFKSKSGEIFILFTAEGSTSFFHLPLSSILEVSASESPDSLITPEKDLSSLVVATETGAPILSLDLIHSEDGEVRVWTASDTRKGVRMSRSGISNGLWKKEEGDGGQLEIQSQGLDCFEFDGQKFLKVERSSESSTASILTSVDEATQESRNATYGASILGLYPALLWPKLSPLIHHLQWTLHNAEVESRGKGTKPKHNKQKMREGHQEVIGKGKEWLEKMKAQA